MLTSNLSGDPLALSLKYTQFKTKNRLNKGPAICQRNEDLLSWRNLYTIVHSSFTCKSPNLEITQTSFRGAKVKPTVVHPHHRIALGNKGVNC